MISDNDFKRLINLSESTILDFKREMYDFVDDKEKIKTAAFIKDIISFANTPRTESSIIIIGIEERKDGSKVFHGLDTFVDDAILQDKTKDKVHPRPVFCFYTVIFENQKYGIIEIPIVKYPSPIVPIKRMKGLDPGCIYFRQGTTNNEAKGLENVRINDWFKDMPSISSEKSMIEEIGMLLNKAIADQDKLSVVISETLIISKRYGLEKLIDFCKFEIEGLKNREKGNPEKCFRYRVHSVYLSPNEIKINRNSNATQNSIKNEMKESDDFKEFQFLFNQPISIIESYIDRIKKEEGRTIVTFKTSAQKVFQENIEKDYPLTIYIFEEDLNSLYMSIRQKLIDLLVGI